jgi:hypothetical protein
MFLYDELRTVIPCHGVVGPYLLFRVPLGTIEENKRTRQFVDKLKAKKRHASPIMQLKARKAVKNAEQTCGAASVSGERRTPQ